ncbi:MAG: TnpV protein [Clostridiales bacterium]|nr:TnpV protein [Clostridiales bacterium]
MKSQFEQMGGTYTQVGDYFIPDLVLPDTKEYHIGKYGRMRRRFLKEQRPIVYTNMVLEGTLFEHLAEIDESCNSRMEIICKAMAEREGVTEALKAADQLEWVRRMNSIRDRAEESILRELVYDM